MFCCSWPCVLRRKVIRTLQKFFMGPIIARAVVNVNVRSRMNADRAIHIADLSRNIDLAKRLVPSG